MDYFEDADIDALILINPDNPSGNFIKKDEVLRLAEWAGEKGIRLIVDESFADFADADEPQSLLSEEILEGYKNLEVVKSISKSFGVPGLRLGLVASADEELIRFIKKDISIWNINSVAEYYLQICEKYKNDYISALEKFRFVRKEFVSKLRKVPYLRVIPSQANFVMCEVLGGYPAEKLAETLLNEHNILIKNLSFKKGINGQYIRVAIKTSEENNLLVNALKDVLGQARRVKRLGADFGIEEAAAFSRQEAVGYGRKGSCV